MQKPTAEGVYPGKVSIDIPKPRHPLRRPRPAVVIARCHVERSPFRMAETPELDCGAWSSPAPTAVNAHPATVHPRWRA